MKKKAVATFLCDLSEELWERHFQWLCIGAERDVLVLSSDAPVKDIYVQTRGLILQFIIHHWKNGEVHRVTLPPTIQIYAHVQQLGAGYICVEAFCNRNEENAQIFGAQGNWLNSWHAGLAIQDIQTTKDEQIWVSYGDEGVFSGDKFSLQGLSCFDWRGQWNFGFRDVAQELPGFAHCYALNVVNDSDTWICYHTDFPRVHIKDKKIIEVFEPPSEMIGSPAFALHGSQFLFIGGYYNRSQTFWRDEATKKQIEVEVVQDDGEPLKYRQVRGRGADLFFIEGAKVWMLSLNDLNF